MTPESASVVTVDESACRRFEAAWNEGRPEPIEHFLPAENSANYLATLTELIHIELELAWKSWAQTTVRPGAGGDGSAHVEAYLARFPCLNQPSIVLRLLEQEYRVRCLYGDRPSPREYCTRFPELVVTGREIEGTLPGETPASDELPQLPGYQVLGFLGRGGMGVVYKARQISLKRLVALKMISPGAGASAKELARFHTEAEAVARLQHPHIVGIYEVGEYRGRPYLALEFMEGGTLAQRLAGTPQPARTAAQHVLTLARAMYVAHQRGIVHRDLKPANILLQNLTTAEDAEGRRGTAEASLPLRSSASSAVKDFTPKIADFGLAKLLDSKTGQTSTGAPLGTPSYMAPEQALGETSAISPATDTYALGAILYEMLTGRPPFRGETALSTIEQVRTQDPVPPTRLHPKVPRDLETICLKCLQKEPRRRYASAEELAEDLQRFLAGESIRARPTPAWERGIKWAKRRPALAALLGVSGGAALTVLIVVLVTNARLQHERDQKESALVEARANFRLARNAVDEMLTEVGAKELAQVPQMEPVQRALLEKALRFYQGFLQQQSTDPLVRQETARAHRRVADIRMRLGQHTQAEGEYHAAIRLQERLTADFPDEVAYRQDLADSHHNRGTLLSEISRPKEAETAYRAALTIREKLADDCPMMAICRQQLAESYDNLGSVLADLGRLPEAQKMYEEALHRLESLVADFPDDLPCQHDLARTCANLGQLLWRAKQYPQAERFLRRAIDLKGKLATTFAHVASYRFGLAICYNDLGLLLWEIGQDQAAEEAYKEALTLQAKLATDFPSVPDYQGRLGGILHNLAQVEREHGELAKARAHLEEAIRCQKSALASNPRNATYRQFFRNHTLDLADTLVAMREHVALSQAATEPVKLFPDDPQEYVIAAESLARCVPLACADARVPQDKRTALADSYAAEAVRMLREAIQRGYRDLKHLKEDPDFACLRSRDDFEKLLKAAEASPR
jgi:serine/threonine protein kinase/Tfp pilus assembly protein PilF